jgi:hypothetical protein
VIYGAGPSADQRPDPRAVRSATWPQAAGLGLLGPLSEAVHVTDGAPGSVFPIRQHGMSSEILASPHPQRADRPGSGADPDRGNVPSHPRLPARDLAQPADQGAELASRAAAAAAAD